MTEAQPLDNSGANSAGCGTRCGLIGRVHLKNSPVVGRRVQIGVTFIGASLATEDGQD